MSEWIPTHWVPEGGLEARAAPDAATVAVARLDPWLEVSVAQVWGDWAQVVCANGWWGWVDGRVLVPRSAPTALAAPTAATPATAVGSRNAGTWSSEAFVARARSAAFALAGALGIVLSAVLPWIRSGGTSADAFDVPLEFLISYDSDLDVGIDVGVLLIVLGVAGLAAVMLLSEPWWRRGVGLGAAAVAGLYVLQVQRWLSAGPARGRPSLLSTVGFGVYVAFVGGLVLAFFPTRWGAADR